MRSAPWSESVRARLQQVQDELARKHNVAIATRDRAGNPLTTPSKSLEQSASLSATALQGLYHCLSPNWVLRHQDVLEGQRLVATLFSGGVTLAALPLFDNSQVAAVVRVAQTFGDVRRQLELLNEQVVTSGGLVPGEQFLDPVDLDPGPQFVAMLEEIEAAVAAALGISVACRPVTATAPLEVPGHLVDLLPVGVFVATIDWQVTAASQALLRMLGYAEATELVGRNLMGEVLDLDFLPLVEEIQGKGQIVARPAKVRRADGEVLPVLLTVAMTEAEGSHQAGYWGLIQHALPAETGPLENLIATWPFPALLVDRAHRVVSCNKAALEAFGFQRDELVGASVNLVVDNAESLLEAQTSYPGAVSAIGEVALVSKAGHRSPARCLPVRGPEMVVLLTLPAPAPHEAGERTSWVENLPLGAVLCTQQGTILTASPAATALTGYRPEELRDMHVAELVSARERPGLEARLAEAVDRGPVDFSVSLRRKDGAEVAVSVRAFAVGEAGESRQTVLILQAVPQARGPEEEQRYRQLVESSRDLYWAIEIPDPDHFELAVPVSLSRGFADIPDLATLNAEGGLLRAKITHTPESWETFKRSCLAVYRTQRVMSGVRTVHVDRDGKVVQTFLMEIFPLYREGRLVGVHGLARDTTEEYLLQQEARRSEERYRLLVEHAAVGVCLVRKGGEVVQINRRGLDILGASTIEELNRQGVASRVEPEVREALARELGRGPVQAREITATRLDGRKVELLLQARVVTSPEHGECVEAWFVDVTRRRRAERRLRESEERFRSFAENIAEGVIIANQAGQISYANRRVAELFGYTRKELSGTPLLNLFHPTERESIRRLLGEILQGQATRVQTECDAQTKKGSSLRVEASLTPRRKAGGVVGAFVVLRDVTQQRSLEEQLQQAQKMESVGILAGGIAHDFNNILTEILGYASLLEAEEELPPHLRGMVQQIIELSSVAGSLTQQLIAFSSNTKPQRRPMQLNEVVRQTARFLAHSLPETIKVKTHLAHDLRVVSGDPVQLQQVLINLCVNARDAMPQGGRILIKTDNLTLSEEQRRQFKNQNLREVVRLRVSDTGVGMDAETLKHIFEPFFTTKPKGKGSGLGLSIVYVIVTRHEGEIQVTSAPGQGATFDIYLPALSEQLEPALERRREPLKGGNEGILLVDDQPEILELGRKMLSKHGYRVLTSTGGRDALELFQERAGEIDLVILDLNMPDGSGEECARQIRTIKPEVAILLTSGYLPGPLGRRELKEVGDGVLQKPFDLQQLLTQVRAALDSKTQQ